MAQCKLSVIVIQRGHPHMCPWAPKHPKWVLEIWTQGVNMQAYMYPLKHTFNNEENNKQTQATFGIREGPRNPFLNSNVWIATFPSIAQSRVFPFVV